MTTSKVVGIDKPISRIVLGAMILSTDRRDECFSLLDAACECGITAFDTAAVYAGGDSERCLGMWSDARGVRDKEHDLAPPAASSPNYGLAEQVENPWGPGCVSLGGSDQVAERKWYAETKMPVFAYSSLGRGLFSGRMTRDNYRDVADDACQKAYCHEVNFRRLDRTMTIRKFVLVAVVLSCLFATQGAANDAVRIVCIGDSITQGSGGRPVMAQSYRYALWKKLIDAELTVAFVGSQTTGFNTTPEYQSYKSNDFINVHEGYWGRKTWEVRDKLKETSAGWKADVALIILGTNDRSNEQTLGPTLKAMSGIIDILRGNNPKMIILIGSPYHEWPPFPKLNKEYAALAATLSTDASPVSTVYVGAGWISHPEQPGTLTADWLHPNPRGDEIIAAGFFAGLKRYLPGLQTQELITEGRGERKIMPSSTNLHE